MKRSWWRTGPPLKHTQPVVRPTIGQLLRQIALLLAVAVLWGGVLLVLLGATSSSNVAFVVEQDTLEPEATGTSVAPGTPAAAATSTAITTPATPTPATGATATRAANATATAPATAAATPAATDTPAPEAAVATLAPAGAAAASISFARDVQPIFNQICVKCHGGEDEKEGLSLKTYAEVMQGSDNGPVIAPGDPANSLLVDMIQKGKMPKRGPRLLPRQIQAIVDWVTAGAPDN